MSGGYCPDTPRHGVRVLGGITANCLETLALEGRTLCPLAFVDLKQRTLGDASALIGGKSLKNLTLSRRTLCPTLPDRLSGDRQRTLLPPLGGSVRLSAVRPGSRI